MILNDEAKAKLKELKNHLSCFEGLISIYVEKGRVTDDDIVFLQELSEKVDCYVNDMRRFHAQAFIDKFCGSDEESQL